MSCEFESEEWWFDVRPKGVGKKRPGPNDERHSESSESSSTSDAATARWYEAFETRAAAQPTSRKLRSLSCSSTHGRAASSQQTRRAEWRTTAQCPKTSQRLIDVVTSDQDTDSHLEADVDVRVTSPSAFLSLRLVFGIETWRRSRLFLNACVTSVGSCVQVHHRQSSAMCPDARHTYTREPSATWRVWVLKKLRLVSGPPGTIRGSVSPVHWRMAPICQIQSKRNNCAPRRMHFFVTGQRDTRFLGKLVWSPEPGGCLRGLGLRACEKSGGQWQLLEWCNLREEQAERHNEGE